MKLIDLYNQWNDTERKEAIAAMLLARQCELASALLSAGFSASALRSAGFSASALRSAEESAEDDIKKKIKAMGREEAEFVLRSINLGLLNGSSYGSVDSCGCFLGSAGEAFDRNPERTRNSNDRRKSRVRAFSALNHLIKLLTDSRRRRNLALRSLPARRANLPCVYRDRNIFRPLAHWLSMQDPAAHSAAMLG